MKAIYRIEPIGHQRIWGSDTLGSQFHLSNTKAVGEVSCVSANSACDCRLYNEGCTLSAFYTQHPEYFRLSCREFPLRVNIMDAKDDLSIQIHPDESPATRAQPEAWYVIHSMDSPLCLGHNWQNEQDFLNAAAQNRIPCGVRRIPSHSGDFFYLKPGTVHAAGRGYRIYELTRQADITYRLYDYQRTDRQGHQRPLHIKQAAQFLYFPQKLMRQTPLHILQSETCTQTLYYDEPDIFTLEKIELHGDLTILQEDFYLYTIIEGSGWINGEQVVAWDTLLQICDTEIHLQGDMTIMAATFKEADNSHTGT